MVPASRARAIAPGTNRAALGPRRWWGDKQKSGPERFFSHTLTKAAVVRTPSNADALEALRSGRADVMGSIKPILFELSNQLPGSQVLDGRPRH